MAHDSVARLLDGLPSNWGRWGSDDEIGGLNFLTPDEVARGLSLIRRHEPYALAITINSPRGDPVWPGRSPAVKLMTQDKGHYQAGKLVPLGGGLEYADDYLTMFLQGSTQFDALGHIWYGDQLYNGFDASTTIGGLDRASVLPLAERTACGAAVLIDMPRFRGKAHLDKGETFGLADLLACAQAQGTAIEKHDIVLIRTGWLTVFYDQGPAVFYAEPFLEPGLTFSRELVEWFHDMEIPLLGTDTIANEVTVDPESGLILPLHSALMRNLGVIFNEILWLEDLAGACAADGQYKFFYTAAPLKVFRGTGAPVNPIAIR
ncbi:MAG: cyclase family protein [Gammaproteobacteria bacterium]|nr:cyclase family protein [Gammaproteobacteria bacterium]